ncbi:TIR domain-containing protein [Novosphingobium sp.]|uniref:toll/interleukin-1 receptor domain-containing protein n=1 Tax=Novosphingobium sp. TaxID=1874826 RepID=UPI003341413A
MSGDSASATGDPQVNPSGKPLASIGNRIAGLAAGVTGTLGQRDFAAFISYSHRDIAIARWLHAAIENYRVPRALVGLDGEYGPVPARLRPVFRDEDELAGASALGPRLEGALARSRALLVICSPAARASQWVDNEIRLFKQLNPGRPVFAVIAHGVPGQDDQACFPESLLWDIDAAGQPDRTQPVEPLAPDLQALDKRVVKLKVIAGLLGVPYDRLHDREQRRRRFFAAIYSSASLILILVLSGLTIAAFSYARIAVRERNAAEVARKAAVKERNDAIAARDYAERQTWLAQQAAGNIRSFVGQDCAPAKGADRGQSAP